MNKAYHLTADGIAELESELDELKNRRADVAARLRAAKAEGDLSENADYAAAMDEQKFVESRIGEIENILLNAELIDRPKHSNKVELGNRVHLQCDGKELTYSVVGSLESDPQAGKISDESPIGKALLGKKVGDTVDIVVPSGTKVCKVTKIS